MSEASTSQAAPATQTQPGTTEPTNQATQGQGTPGTGTPGTNPAGSGTPAPQGSGLDFIPEQYKSSSWAQKYKTPEDFFKGVDNLAQMAGKKEVVQGIQRPGEGATPEDWSKFYSQLGRPESADKYKLPEDVKAPEGIDLAGEKKAFSELAHKNGLSDEQAAGLFKDYIDILNTTAAAPKATEMSLDDAKKAAFGDNADANYALANKAAEKMGITDRLNAAGLGRNPLVLQILAETANGMGEGEFIKNDSNPTGKTLLEQARELQSSDAYKRGDKATHRQVEAMYKKVYPN